MSDDFDEFTRSRSQGSVIVTEENLQRCAIDLAGLVLPPVKGVRLAIRCLPPHCRERWPLELYWDAARQENEIGRAQGVTAAFNGIVRQLRLAGRYEDRAPTES
ncbi:hypothetical protein QUC32_28570 (plasmid) [Novosphingobium resinovorum]|uniref:hypothetical protein n=1 Tax=Novosphingobium TaxID=165696 RepID=UPI001E64F7C6|nr:MULTISPECIES: hypothetical protein [Novosphingobium]WJM30308.1 hypothetical protein QUC32_28570 [Novosphingobium resinovorum]